MRARIEVQGIKEFQRSVKKMDADLGKQVRVVLNGAGAIVVRHAKPKIPKRSGAAADSLRLRSSQREARIAAGGRKARYYPWLDFGGRTGPNRSVRRQFITEGRYIYPTVREHNAEIQEAMSAGLVELATSAGLDVT